VRRRAIHPTFISLRSRRSEQNLQLRDENDQRPDIRALSRSYALRVARARGRVHSVHACDKCRNAECGTFFPYATFFLAFRNDGGAVKPHKGTSHVNQRDSCIDFPIRRCFVHADRTKLYPLSNGRASGNVSREAAPSRKHALARAKHLLPRGEASGHGSGSGASPRRGRRGRWIRARTDGGFRVNPDRRWGR